jgi:hypothetical protein
MKRRSIKERYSQERLRESEPRIKIDNKIVILEDDLDEMENKDYTDLNREDFLVNMHANALGTVS